MLCIKCKKEISDDSAYCKYCGKKQNSNTNTAKHHKREHGTGTIYQDKRYKNSWLAFAPSTKLGGGRDYIGCYSTRVEARNALEEFIKNGRPDLYNATLSDVYDIWSKVHYTTVSENAVRMYRSMWKHFESIGRMHIRDIKTAHIQEIINQTSKGSVNGIKVLATMLFKCAMENDIVSKNYAEFVKLPKIEKEEKRIFTDSEIKSLWEHSDEKPVQVVLLMIYTGFRIGEVLALKVEDIHLNEGYMVGGEKTKAGKNRVVPFPPNIPELKTFLSEWCSQIESGNLFKMTQYYFKQHIFYAALQIANIDPEGITPHSTRHTFASLSSSAGIEPESLQKIIGHANFATTAEVYIHKDIPKLIEEMRKIKK